MTRFKRLRRAAPLAPLALVVVLALGVGSAGAGTPLKTGKYSGATTQGAVASPYNAINFTVKKGKVKLTTEPSVVRESCISTPVFTLGGTTATKKLDKNRTFTFTHTFLGNKIDKIHGKFVSSNEVQGYAIYHFQAQFLCSEGKSRVNFSAKHK
jgi:hypothetical protein